MKKFVEQDKVFAVMGNVGTPNNLAFKDYLAENGVPNIGFATGSGLLVNPQGFQKLAFGVLPNYTFEGNLLAQYAADTLKVKSAAVLYQNDAFGKEAYQSFVKTAKAKGIDVKAEVPYEAGATDLSAQALKLQQSGAELVFINAVPGPGAAAAKEMDKLGYKPKLMLAYVLNDAQFWSNAGKAAEGALTTSFTPLPDSDDPKVVAFRDFMKKTLPNEQVGNFALWGYIGAQIMEEGLKRAGKDLSRETLIAGLESLDNWTGSASAAPVTYGKDNRSPFKSLFFLKYDSATNKTVKISDPIEYK
jgi:branched-chain amino acid transport system substrate-binding protein